MCYNCVPKCSITTHASLAQIPSSLLIDHDVCDVIHFSVFHWGNKKMKFISVFFTEVITRNDVGIFFKHFFQWHSHPKFEIIFFSTTISIQSKSNNVMLKVYQPTALPIRPKKKSAENSSIKEVTHKINRNSHPFYCKIAIKHLPWNI